MSDERFDPNSPPPPPPDQSTPRDHLTLPLPTDPAADTRSFVIGGPPLPRKRKVTPIVAIGTVLVVVAAALAVVMARSGGSSSGGRNVGLALSFSKGAVYRYDITVGTHLTMSAAGRSIPVDATVRGPESMRVIRRSSSGLATIDLSVGPMSASAAGQLQTMPRQTITLQIAPDGRVTGGGLIGGMAQSFGGSSLPGTNQLTPFLPDHKVAPGDSWNTTVDRSLEAIGSGSIRATAHSTYERNETIRGVRVAVIQSKIDMPLDFTIDFAKIRSRFGSGPSIGTPQLTSGRIRYSGSAHILMLSWLDLARHQIERMAQDAEMNVGLALEGSSIPNNPGRIRMQGTMWMRVQRRG